jgi:hypothetical protein
MPPTVEVARKLPVSDVGGGGVKCKERKAVGVDWGERERCSGEGKRHVRGVIRATGK